MRETLINNFLRISMIPRESGQEEKIADFFVEVAKQNNLYYFKDENNNVLIKKKGTKTTTSIGLQAHLDMVCKKTTDSLHNFKEDPIEVIIDGDKVTAKDTTLGADQGVGLAMMLTLLEDNKLITPDIEFIFTVEEETSFKGTVTFPYSKVTTKRIINLDNSDDDSILIGADADILNEYYFKDELIQNNLPSYKISLTNLSGGNSGENMESSKNNAIITLIKRLENKDVYIKSINGGTNEIDVATDASIVINTKLDVYNIFKDINVTIEKIKNNSSFTKIASKNIINEILNLKSGLLSNSTSANLGLIKTENNKIVINYLIRSIDEKELNSLNEKINNLNLNFKCEEVYKDPVWKANKNSFLLKTFKNVYYQINEEYPEEKICHGSIECSSISKRINNLDIISIGSKIRYFHTVEEVTYISSWIKTYNCLTRLLEII